MSKLREADALRRQQSDAGPDFSEALARGLHVILAFSEERRQMSLSDVAKVVDLPRATVRRALYTLAHMGFVEQDGRSYRLTAKVLQLASAYLSSNAISTFVQPVCERLARLTGDSCMAAVLEADEAVTVTRASPAPSLAAASGLGFRLPAYCTALGRVLLSALPDEELESYLDRTSFVAPTTYTITNRHQIREEILKVRTEGYAYVDQEAEYGYRSVAVPVRRADGRAVAAINVGGRVERTPRDVVMTRFLPWLKEGAEELRQQLL